MRSLLAVLSLASLVACASQPRPNPTPPPPTTSTTRTTGAPLPNDTYGQSDVDDGWANPAAAVGNASHGSAASGALPIDSGLAP